MSRMLAIARRDLAAAFASPVAYALLSCFALLTGVFLLLLVAVYVLEYQQIMAQSFGAPRMDEILADLNVVQLVLIPLFQNFSVMYLMMLPIVTMRSLAEEAKAGTDELLLTAPVSVNQIVLGKYLALLGVTTALMATTIIPVGSLFLFGNPPLKIVLSSYLGLFLLGSTFVAVGLFASSLTESQIIAAVTSFSALLVFLMIGWVGEQLGNNLPGRALTYLAVTNHFDDFTEGIVDSTHIVYHLSVTFFFVFLAARVVESRRWR